MCQEHRGEPTRCDACPEPALLPENRHAARLYLAVDTQWRYLAGGLGPARLLGLDYTAVAAALDMMGWTEKRRRRVFEQLRQMEAETITIFRERAERHGH